MQNNSRTTADNRRIASVGTLLGWATFLVIGRRAAWRVRPLLSEQIPAMLPRKARKLDFTGKVRPRVATALKAHTNFVPAHPECRLIFEASGALKSQHATGTIY